MNLRSLLLVWLTCLPLALTVGACGKPKADECKKAVANIRNLYDTAGITLGVSPQAAVRSCRGGATRESVRCMTNAKTVKDLEACVGDEFFADFQARIDEARTAKDAEAAADKDKAEGSTGAEQGQDQ